MYYAEDDTIENFLIQNICEAIGEYNEEIEPLCDDDDLILIEDGLNEISIAKIIEICGKLDKQRAPLKMIVLWIAVYLYNRGDINMQGKLSVPSFNSCLIENEKWYEYHQQSNQGVKPIYWSEYLGGHSDKKYVIIDFRKGIEEVINVFDNQNNVNLEICVWIILLFQQLLVENRVYLCTDIPTSDLEALKLRILSGIKLSILLSGKILHEMQEYIYEPLELTKQRGSFDCLINYNIISNSYEQYEQVYEVINEYNGTRGIIEKYLKLYQVLEELMVRINVVKFSKETISVRALEEFKSIKKSEREALKKLFSHIFYVDSLSNPQLPDKKLLDEIRELWNASDPTYSLKLNKQFNETKSVKMEQPCNYNFNTLLGNYEVEKIAEFYSFWIYELRCEIVHNKATEYHMTYINLNADLKNFIISFFLPSMELIVFHTMIRVPKCLQYDREAIEIKLW